jgi:hypothetical protein
MKNKAAQQLGRLGGKAKTEAKASAARANGAAGGRPGMYSVLIRREWGEDEYQADSLSKSAAADMAKGLVAAGESGIYVEFFRTSDGQRGYLNADGNHNINGEDWS